MTEMPLGPERARPKIKKSSKNARVCSPLSFVPAHKHSTRVRVTPPAPARPGAGESVDSRSPTSSPRLVLSHGCPVAPYPPPRSPSPLILPPHTTFLVGGGIFARASFAAASELLSSPAFVSPPICLFLSPPLSYAISRSILCSLFSTVKKLDAYLFFKFYNDLDGANM